MGILLCEPNFRDVWIRNKSVRAEIGQILHTDTHPHTHTTAAKLVVRMTELVKFFSYLYHRDCFTDMLQSYKSALVRHETAAIELGEQIENQKTAEMTAKYKECNEAERQLTQIETRLGE